jgi:microcystin degradation protein MlrC
MSAAPVHPYRVAIGQISQESDSFVSTLTELRDFQNSFFKEGDSLFSLAGTDTEVAGMLAVCAEHEAEVVPLIATRSISGGPLSTTCYATLKAALLEPLAVAGRVDAVLLSMHGSMLAEDEDDPEGDLLTAARTIVGPDTPIVCTLDLHGNVTPRMVEAATALVAYSRYPHDDVATTGERAARLLFTAMRGDVCPSMALAKVPMLVSGCEGQTFGDAPMAHLTRRARELEQQPGILSVSCFHVHPYLDVAGMGSGAVVVTDADPDLAARTAIDLANEFWERREAFMPEVLSVRDAIERGMAITGGPVILVDTADCAGGGAAADSVALLRDLIALGVTAPAYLMVVDPGVATTCATAGIGAEVTTEVGYHIDPTWGQPLGVTGRVSHLCDGRFRYRGGAFGGTDACMGLSAVLEIGPIRLLVMSAPTYDWADEQFRAVGLDPAEAKFIGVKNPMNYRFAYEGLAKAAFVVDTPGPTPAHVLHLPYEKMRRPMFPFDHDIPGLVPRLTLREADSIASHASH